MASVHAPFDSHQATQPPRRSARRSPASVPALIGIAGDQHSVRVYNLSAGGAMIEAVAPLAVGARMTFSCGTIEACGTVLWERLDRYGLAFDAAVTEEDIQRQMSRSSALAGRRAGREE